MMEFNIHVLAIPAHTSHLTQPLDDVPFANLKTQWNANLLAYLFDNVGAACPKVIFLMCFWPAWHTSITVANIQAGFRETGIFPVNRNKISPALLASSQATDNVTNAQGKENVQV